MSEAKKTRFSKYHASDESFVYDHSTNYDIEDFKNLSIVKLQSIASTLNLRNVKMYKKNDLGQLILNKHMEQQSLIGHEEEEKEKASVLEFTEQYKNKFVQYTYNNDVYYQASLIAESLGYQNTRKAIIDHVDPCNKITYDRLQTSQSTLHPHTVFINEKGVLQLMLRSHMPLASGKKRGLEEVYVATTALYEKKDVYKIGKSECSKKRIQDMNTGRAPDDDLYLCYAVACSNASEAEQIIHSLLDDYRISPNREFFKYRLDEIIRVIDNVCGKAIINT